MEPRAREPFTALDWIAVVFTVFLSLVVVALAPIGATFRAMYADFGSETLPLLTQFTTSMFGPPSLALVPSVVLGVGLRATRIGARRAGVVAAFVLALVAFAVCYVGDYLPVWQVADAVRE